MEDMNIRKVASLFLVLLIASLGGHFWQYISHNNATINYREEILTLKEDNTALETDINMYLAYIQHLEEQLTPDIKLSENQRAVISRFIQSYYTFVAGEEEKRIDTSSEFVTAEMLEIMREALTDDPGGNYHLSLTASNINIYQGQPNEFLATFNVEYESDITNSMTQILTVRFLMADEKIAEFTILSASEVFNFD